MKKIILGIIVLAIVLMANAQTGSITNIQISQRTDGSSFIDIRFDLSGAANVYNILLEVSFDGGGSYVPVSGAYISGDVAEVSPGQNKEIVWNGFGSFPNMYSKNTTLKITATTQGSISGDWPRDTETAVVDVTNPATGKTWMDRNLGASRAATSSTDAEAYGDLYQWGRAADGHQKRTSGTTSTLSSSDTPGHGNFITSSIGANWGWRSPQNDNLWQGVNGVNNPCPPGYRLPTEAELNAERLSWSSNNSAGAFASPLKLPVAGGRSFSNGSLYDVNTGGYWSSTVDGIDSRYLIFRSSSAGMSSYARADGMSVRCLKDNEAIPNKQNLNLDVNPTGAGEVSGAGTYETGESVSITAVANAGYSFVEWTGDTDYLVNPKAANTTVTMPAQNISLEAYFKEAGDPESGTFTDTRDDQTYKWVKIGDQIWMAENLRYLPSVVGRGTGSETTPFYYVYGYDGTDVNAAKATANYQNFGVLYNWPAAMAGTASSSANPSGVQGVCPPGWHVPSHDEWTQLEQYVCNQLGNLDCATKFPYNHNTWGLFGTNEGNALKSCRQVASPLGGVCNNSDHPRWDSHSTHYGTDAFGFSALPGGTLWHGESFSYLGSFGAWWSSSETLSTTAAYRGILNDYGNVFRDGNDPKMLGFSVRCVRDN